MVWKLALVQFVLWNQVTIAAGETTCHPDEYEVPGNPSCSRACPAGYYVSRPISLDHPIGACSPCERGTFRAHPSVETQCVPCGQCREDQEVVKQCSPTCDLECQCQQGRFFCDSVDCAESCIRCTSCEDSAVLQPCNATRDAVCATNPQSGNPGPPWACMGVDVHACTTIFVFIVIFIIIGAIVIRYFVVSCRRTGSRNMRSGYSPGTGQSSDLESGPPAPGGGAGLELRRNSASLASESPGSAEPLPCVNGSLAAPREPEEQARIPEAPRTTASQSHLPPLMSRSRSSDHPVSALGPRLAAERSRRRAVCGAPAEFPAPSPGLPEPAHTRAGGGCLNADCSVSWSYLGTPDCLTCLLRNLYTGQEATVRTGQGATHCFKIGKDVCEGCMVSPCLFNCCGECRIMRNAGPDESQAEI